MGSVELHCHLLPAIDDGPPDEEHSLALAEALLADGTDLVAVTPHRTRRLMTPVAELRARVDELRALLAHAGLPLTVLSGSEVAVDALIDMDPAEVQALRLGETGPLLVELPLRPAAGDPSWPVRELLAGGTPVLLAHPERCPMLRDDLDRLVELRELGARSQTNAGSLLGEFGPITQLAAAQMLDAGLVDVIASDSHHHSLRPPRMREIRQWLAEHRPSVDADALTVHTPRVLVHPTELAA